MKHPFHTLYYTGLTVLIFLFLFCGLLIFNLSDIIELIPKNKTPKVQSNVVLNPVVLKTSTPKPFVELNDSKVEKGNKNKNSIPQTTTNYNDTTTKNTNGGQTIPLNMNDSTDRKDTI
jgi:hypothetical protein